MPNITNVNEFNAIPSDPPDDTVYTVTKSFSMATAVSHTIDSRITFTALDGVVLSDIRRPLFIQVGAYSEISNIHLKNINIVDHTNIGVGAIMCYGDYPNIINCTIEDGYIKGDYELYGTTASVGGIIGIMGGDDLSGIQGCTNKGVRVEGGSAGGIAGDMYGVAVSNCKNSGNIEGKRPATAFAAGYAGGICAYASGSFINCYNSGTIRGVNAVGGIVAWADEMNPISITLCKNSGYCHGGSNTGGIIGTMLEGEILDNNMNSGKIVSDYQSAGGIVGFFKAVVTPTSFTINNNVVTESCTIKGGTHAAGIIGELLLWNSDSLVEVKDNLACCASIIATGSPYLGIYTGYRIYYSRGSASPLASGNRANKDMRLTAIVNDGGVTPGDSYNNDVVTPGSPYYGDTEWQGVNTTECHGLCVTIKYSNKSAQHGKPPKPVSIQLGSTYYPTGSPGTLRTAGRVLCGWSTEPGGPALSSFTAWENTTLYPVWKRNMFFDILYCGNCGCIDFHSDKYKCPMIKGFKIKLRSVGSTTDMPLPIKTSYQLMDTTTGKSKVVESNANGFINAPNLTPSHTYRLTAISGTPGIKLDDTVHTLSVDASGKPKLDGSSDLTLRRDFDPATLEQALPKRHRIAPPLKANVLDDSIFTDSHSLMERIWEDAGVG
ncbi:hypothetical protein AGMMS49992_13250 [Clostridia bacterium]|nr:hypothetical protein AGMMS49992_13250 [Clostridia bacterium]